MLSHHHAAVYANQFPVGESLCYDASCLLVVFRLVVCRINHGIVYDDEVGVCGRQSFTVLIHRLRHLLHHEEIESLVKNYPTIKRARFWMTFGQQYLTYLDCIQNLGMSRIDEIEYEAPLADNPDKKVKVKIVPLQFLKAVLPNPQDLGENYDGETSIGCRIRGLKDGKELTYYVYNNCSHQAAYQETGMQGVSYTTGVPAMIGAMMFFKGLWRRPGVWNVEEFDPDPFMEQLNKQGLPWHEIFNGDLEL